MKTTSILKIAVLALPLVFTACKSKKKVEPVVMTEEMKAKADFISSVKENAQTTKFLTSKVKFSVEVGPQKITLTGNLRMKRDDVIRLQLMAFGFVEAGRIEMTKDYVLIMDRINKQYLKAPWMSVDFLRNSGMNFQTVQALFWNELFRPNQTALVKTNDKQVIDSIANYSIIDSGDDMIIDRKNMTDASIMIIMREEVQAYFAGDKTLDEVIEIINNRARTYYGERG